MKRNRCVIPPAQPRTQDVRRTPATAWGATGVVAIGDRVTFKEDFEGEGIVLDILYLEQENGLIADPVFVIADDSRGCDPWHPHACLDQDYGCSVVYASRFSVDRCHTSRPALSEQVRAAASFASRDPRARVVIHYHRNGLHSKGLLEAFDEVGNMLRVDCCSPGLVEAAVDHVVRLDDVSAIDVEYWPY